MSQEPQGELCIVQYEPYFVSPLGCIHRLEYTYESGGG